MPDQPDKPKSTDLRFQCPKCSGKIIVDASAVGFYANCPHCNTRILIKRQAPEAVPAQPPAPSKVPVAQKPEPPVAAKSVLVATQKMGGASATMKGLAIGAPRLVPAPPTASKTEPAKPVPDAAAEEARQSLTNLIEGLKRENKELKRRIATAGSASATAHGLTLETAPATLADAVAEANKELAKLRERLAGLEEIHREDEVAAALLRSQLDSARTSADHFKRKAEEAVARNQNLQTDIARHDDELRNATSLANTYLAEAARSASRALSLEQERAALLDERLRLSRDLSAAACARDLATADIALARQTLRVAEVSHRITEAGLKEAVEAARGEAATRAQQLAATEEKLRSAEALLAAAPKPEQLQKLSDEAAQQRESIAALQSELASLRISELAFRNHHATSAAEIAALRDEAAKSTTEISRLRTEIANGSIKTTELQMALDAVKADHDAAVEKSRALQARLEQLNNENDRMLSEKSALALAFDEAKDRAQKLDGEKWRADELARKLAALTEEHAAANEQLAASDKVAADMQTSLKRIDELQLENNKLREQIKKTEHEIAMRASPHGLELVESRFRRRIEELEATVSTASSVTQSLRARIADLEKDQRRVPLPDQDAARAQEEKVAALQKQLFEAESLARKMQAERDAATSAKIEAEAAVDALSGQARDLQDQLDALNK